jgi:hypothetical protein
MVEDFVPYPEIEDPDFYKKIYTKKEFYKTKINQNYMSQRIEDVCNPDQFNIQSYQEFPRNYLSPWTPFNGLLLMWGTGVGKSCGGIQITEGLKDIVHKFGKKIYIIAKKQIRTNFWKELYSIKREEGETIPGSKQCTGASYYVSREEEPDIEKREKKIKNKIKEYYEFFGTGSFANYVDYTVKKEHKDIGEFFSNSVFLIDEAHGLTGDKAGTGKDGKDVKDASELSDESEMEDVKRPDDDDETIDIKKKGKDRKVSDRGILSVFHEILSKTHGVKLILMTATPMKDNAAEIADLLDLLLINDKRPMVDRKQLFPEKNLVNEKYLLDLSKGYVSYVRGENPISFPKVIEADEKHMTNIGMTLPITYLPKPAYDELGNEFDYDHIKKTHLIRCPMSIWQYANYRKILSKKESKKSGSIDLLGRQASNIIFPTSTLIDGVSGNAGFNQSFDEHKETKMGKGIKKSYSIQYKYKSFNKGFLNIDRIGQYSKKFEVYLKNVINSKGIVYTYSDFVGTGAKIIALMLEENGYKRYKSSTNLGSVNLLYQEDHEKKYRCAKCSKFKKDPCHTDKKHAQYCNFVQATYVLFTGDESKYATEEISVTNSFENKDGELIKIIVGTRVSGEGIDYKRIRQVHIIDPWHNNTRLHQVIGRGSRWCSHKDLPPDDRNVVVFKYCSANPDLSQKYLPNLKKLMKRGKIDDNIPSDETDGFNLTFKDLFMETSDEKVYRRIEDKDLFIKQIERILKKSAVDCALNKFGNHFPNDRHLNGTRDCDYTDCNYKCEGGIDELKKIKINTDTYNSHFSEIQINRVQKMISEIFRLNYVSDYVNIVKLIKSVDDAIDEEYIQESLDRIIGNPPQKQPIQITDKFKRTGYVIFAKPYYIFQPNDITDQRVPLYYRYTPLTIKKKFLNLEPLRNEIVSKMMRTRKQKIHSPQEKDEDEKYGDEKKGKSKPEKKDEKLQFNHDDIKKLNDIKNRYEMLSKVDRLPSDIQALIYESIYGFTDYDKEFVQYVIKHYNNLGKLYGYNDNTTGKIKFLGHHIDNTVRLYDETKKQWRNYNEDSDEDRQKLSLMKEQLNIYETKTHKKDSENIQGFIQYNQRKKEHEFKLIDFEKQTLKMTKPQINKKEIRQAVSKKTHVAGKVCKTYKRDELIEYAKNLKIKGASNETKDTLCDIIEWKLRELEISDKNKKWFHIRN